MNSTVFIQNKYYVYEFCNSKTSNTHRLLVNLNDKIKLKRSDTIVALPNLSIYYTWRNIYIKK